MLQCVANPALGCIGDWSLHGLAVGDAMMKEGHDHPPLKNIFDWQRGSAVDKGRMIGRALRKYFDPVRDRWLGETIIDTVIYSGHEDLSGVDAQRRRRALHYAVKGVGYSGWRSDLWHRR